MNLLQKLDGREWQVIVLRFGLMDGDFKSIAEISEDLSINRQQIRQIESEVINEFRHSDHIKQMLGELENREQLVIAMRFGLTDATPKTLKDVSEVLHLTIGGVRQIERVALRKLIYVTLGAPFRHFEELFKDRRAKRARILRKVDAFDKLHLVVRNLAQEYGRNPSISEIAERLEITSEQVENALELDQELRWLRNPEVDEVADRLAMTLGVAGRSEMTSEEIGVVLKHCQEQTTIEHPIDANKGVELVRIQVHPGAIADNALVGHERDSLSDRVYEKLQTLEPREQQVLVMRFGLDDGKENTLQEIGDVLDLTRERVRQIEKAALSKLKHRLPEED